MRVSVHVATKDRASELACLLNSLARQTHKEFDVVILDDCYGTALNGAFKFVHDIIGRLRQQGHGVIIYRNEASYGVCKARQSLIELDPWRENPAILRLDDDQVLEPDYISRLVSILEVFPDCGIATGVTPNLAGPDYHRNIPGSVMNRIQFDKEGNIKSYADDCGILYDEDRILPAHQFRSSALMRREMFERGLEYEKGLSLTGFREEFFLSIRAALMGYKCYVDTGAIAWHAPAQSGGCRAPDYEARVRSDEARMHAWVKKHHEAIAKALNIESP